jgi:hypothetical protein
VKRPGYREAIEWIVCNDDTSWLQDSEPVLSVTAAMVHDLYGVSPERIIRDPCARRVVH